MERRNVQHQVPHPHHAVRVARGAVHRAAFILGVLTMLARTPQDEPQHAAHVVDYTCWAALKHLRTIGACNRQTRKLTDDEFDHNQFSIENDDGEIY